MKSVLFSIKPKYCELIASEEKTIEVRKTKPKLDTPFKCYIYCTKGELLTRSNNNSKIYVAYSRKYQKALERNGNITLSGKVIGEFVCGKIEEIRVVDTELMRYVTVNDKAVMFISDETCFSVDELYDYLWPKNGYGFHISDLVIYDKPKELSEFHKPIVPTGLRYENDTITRPPQSWLYVEEVIK